MVTTFNALEFARQKGIRKVLFASSRECYGNLPARRFKEELKRYRKKVQRAIVILLAGIDQNAKLLAQEAKIHLWDLQVEYLYNLF